MRALAIGWAFLAWAAAMSPAAAQDPALRDAWESLHVGAAKIGHAHQVVDRVDAAGQAVVRVVVESSLSIQRFSDTLTMAMRVTSYERLNGQVYAVESEMVQAGQRTASSGRLQADGRFQLTLETAGVKRTQEVAWGDDVLGPVAFENLLRDKPLKAGEKRTFRMFLAEVNEVADVTLTGLGKAKAKLRDGKEAELPAVRMEQSLGAKDARKLPATTIWLDDKGGVFKTEASLGPLVLSSFRVGRAEALGEPLGKGVDLGLTTLVPIDKPIPDAHFAKAVTYRLEGGDPAALAAIPFGRYQKRLDSPPGTLRLMVERAAPPENSPPPKPGQVPDEFLQPNGFIQSDDPAIIAVAKQVGSNVTDPWERSRKLERWVHDNIKDVNFTVAFATASEVMSTKAGDCTEHGVLLAALCRAAGVPSRVAMGLVYVTDRQVMGYHMWTEVFVAGDWYALDATIGNGFVAGEHIKVGDTSLKGVSAMSTLLPVVQFMGAQPRIVLEAVSKD